VGRRSSSERKGSILAAAVDYVLAHGLADLSLRPLAAAIRTSPRMLLYHFGSKEGLIAEVLAAARARQRAALAQSAANSRLSPAELLAQFWRQLGSASAEAYVRLFFEVYGLALHQNGSFDGFAGSAVTEWIDFVEQGLARAGVAEDEARVEATLLVAGTRGLLLDLLATRDRARVDAAMERLVAQLASWGPVGAGVDADGWRAAR